MNVVCVTGMHRSGTSMVSGLLALLGADLGPADRVMGAKEDNPKGFFENIDITALNDDLLAELGGQWDTPQIHADGWHLAEQFEPFRRRARAIVAKDFGDDSTAVWKDPRLSLVLPFWSDVVDVTAAVLVIRHPDAVAASLQARDGHDRDRAHRLWLTYVVEAYRHAPGSLVVAYEDILESPTTVAKELAAHAGLPFPPEASEAVEEFVDAELDRSKQNTDSPSLADRLYQALRAGADISDIAESLHREWVVSRQLEERERLVTELEKHRDILQEYHEELTTAAEANLTKIAEQARELGAVSSVLAQQNDLLGEAEAANEDLGRRLMAAEDAFDRTPTARVRSLIARIRRR